MSKYHIKNGVSLIGLQLPMRRVIEHASRIWLLNGRQLVITAGTESINFKEVGRGPYYSSHRSIHSAASLHPFGLALDLRTNYFPDELVEVVADQLRDSLGAGYDVVVEKTHIHVEWDSE